MNIEIANRLAMLRKQSGLSQEQLADKLNISRQAVSKWERAESSPDTDNVIALARLYQVSLDELLKMDPEAEDDELFARLSAQNAAHEKESEKENEPTGEAPHRDVSGGEVVHEKDEPKQRLWVFQRADGKIDLKLFPYPIIVTLVYLLIGALFDLWHPGWMLFLTIPVYYTALSREGGFDLNRIPYPLLVAILYLVIGFAWDLWHPGWIIFFTIPLYYTMAGKLIKGRINQIIIAVMLLCVCYLLGVSLGHLFRLWLIGPALALVVLGMTWNTKK